MELSPSQTQYVQGYLSKNPSHLGDVTNWLKQNNYNVPQSLVTGASTQEMRQQGYQPNSPYSSGVPQSGSSALGFGGSVAANALPSFENVWGGLVSHPLQSLAALGGGIAGGVAGAALAGPFGAWAGAVGGATIAGGEAQSLSEGKGFSNPMDSLGSLFQHFSTRYSNPDTAINTIANDPAGAALDIAIMMDGFGSALDSAKIGMTSAADASAARAAGEPPPPSTGTSIRNAAGYINPISAPFKMFGGRGGQNQKTDTAIPKDLQPLAEEARKYKSAEEFVKAQNLIHRGDTTAIPFNKMDTVSAFNPAEKESLSAFANTPGLYFTTDESNALSYGKNLTSVGIKPDANILDTKIALDRKTVDAVLKSNPRLNDALSNFSENKSEAYKQMLDSVMSEKDPIERLKAIWADGQFSNKDFVEAMKNQGIDGIKVYKDGHEHYVIYNKDAVQTKSQLTDFYNQATKGGEKPQNQTALAAAQARLQEQTGQQVNFTAGQEGGKLAQGLEAIASQMVGGGKMVEKLVQSNTDVIKTQEVLGSQMQDAFQTNPGETPSVIVSGIGEKIFNAQKAQDGLDITTFAQIKQMNPVGDVNLSKEYAPNNVATAIDGSPQISVNGVLDYFLQHKGSFDVGVQRVFKDLRSMLASDVTPEDYAAQQLGDAGVPANKLTIAAYMKDNPDLIAENAGGVTFSQLNDAYTRVMKELKSNPDDPMLMAMKDTITSSMGDTLQQLNPKLYDSWIAAKQSWSSTKIAANDAVYKSVMAGVTKDNVSSVLEGFFGAKKTGISLDNVANGMQDENFTEMGRAYLLDKLFKSFSEKTTNDPKTGVGISSNEFNSPQFLKLINAVGDAKWQRILDPETYQALQDFKGNLADVNTLLQATKGARVLSGGSMTAIKSRIFKYFPVEGGLAMLFHGLNPLASVGTAAWFLLGDLATSKFIGSDLGQKVLSSNFGTAANSMINAVNSRSIGATALQGQTNQGTQQPLKPLSSQQIQYIQQWLQKKPQDKQAIQDYLGQHGFDSSQMPQDPAATPPQTPATSPTSMNPASNYNLTTYATDPKYTEKVFNATSTVPQVSSAADAQSYIEKMAPNSPITGDMVLASASKYGIDPRLMLGQLQVESNFGTKGAAVKTNNPGNVGNVDSGKTKKFATVEQALDAMAYEISRRKIA